MNKYMTYFWIAVAGIGFGWMMGLSNSPVVSNILTSVIGIVVVAVAALSGLDADKIWIPKVNSFAPISIFIISTAIALTVGVYVRSNMLLVQKAFINQPGAGGAFSSRNNADICSQIGGLEYEQAKLYAESLGDAVGQHSFGINNVIDIKGLKSTSEYIGWRKAKCGY